MYYEGHEGHGGMYLTSDKLYDGNLQTDSMSAGGCYHSDAATSSWVKVFFESAAVGTVMLLNRDDIDADSKYLNADDYNV